MATKTYISTRVPEHLASSKTPFDQSTMHFLEDTSVCDHVKAVNWRLDFPMMGCREGSRTLKSISDCVAQHASQGPTRLACTPARNAIS